MNEVEKSLFRTRKTLRQVCSELNIDIDEADVYELDQCSSCSIWLKYIQLKTDADDNLICKQCWDAYGA